MTGHAVNVLLDLDGTLTDPREGIVACLRHALVGTGIECPSDSELERYIGPPLQESLRELIGANDPGSCEMALSLYRERFTTVGMFENAVYPAIPSALSSLRGLGAKLFVATSKPQEFAERIIQHFRLDNYFTAIYGSDLSGTRSDKAELISHILKAESLSAKTTHMVGDRKYDVIGARANDVRAIGALWGYGTREELVAAGATALCEEPGMVAAVLSSNYAIGTDARSAPLSRALPGADHREH